MLRKTIHIAMLKYDVAMISDLQYKQPRTRESLFCSRMIKLQARFLTLLNYILIICNIVEKPYFLILH